MEQQKVESPVLRAICLAIGIGGGLVFMFFVLKMSGAIPGAIAGGGGALLGLLLYTVVMKLKG